MSAALAIPYYPVPVFPALVLVKPLREVGDIQLLGRIKAGDAAALTLLYSRHSRRVHVSALRVLRDASAAEDVVQEVFLMIWRRPELLSAQCQSFASWMSVVGRNRALDLMRSRMRQRAVCLEDVVLASPRNYASEVEVRIMRERAGTIIDELPEETRVLIEMAFYQGMTHLEIAEQTGVPLGTVKSKIRNGLLRVRDSFQAPQCSMPSYSH